MKKIVLIGLCFAMVLCLCSCGNAKDEKLSSISAQLVTKSFKSSTSTISGDSTFSAEMTFSANGVAEYEEIFSSIGYLTCTRITFDYEIKKETEDVYYINLTVANREDVAGGGTATEYAIGDKEKFYIELSDGSVTMIYNDDQKLKFK